MPDWLTEYATELTVAASVLSAIVWVVYLHLLLLQFRRQHQSMILINRSGAKGSQARCFITNMGSEPIYIYDIIARIDAAGERHTVTVTDREESDFKDFGHPSERTTQGPLKGGEMMDTGSFTDLFNRAETKLGKPGLTESLENMELIVAAAASHATHLVAARRSFRAERNDGELLFVPEQVRTHQVRNRLRLRKIRHILDQELTTSPTTSGNPLR